MPPLLEKPRPTIDDVAAALGMAKSTVSRCMTSRGTFSEATRQRVMKVAQEMGYEPNPVAQRLANKSATRLVYLCACNLDVGLATAKVLTIQKALKASGWEVPIYSVANDNDEADVERTQAEEVRDLCRQHPRAIVFAAQRSRPAVLPELRQYQQQGGIVVSFDTALDLDCDQVIFDREQNAYLAARHLIEQGHRKLGINLSRPAAPIEEHARNKNPRYRGFCRAMREAGLTPNPAWFFEPGGYEQGGVEIARQFLALRDRPTGVCIVNDYSALAFMSELRDAGVRIPEELSVVGLDNQLAARFCPVPLTSATHPVEEIVAGVVQLLLARLEGSVEPAQTLHVSAGLIERKSVAAPPRKV